MHRKKKPAPLSHEEKALARVTEIVRRGETLGATGVSGPVTIGRWTPAVGPTDQFAVYSYGRAGASREGLSAAEAAEIFVCRVGCGRARVAAIEGDRKAGRPAARVVPSSKGHPRALVLY